MQSFELWHPVSDVPEFLAGAFVVQLGSEGMLVVCDGQFQTGDCAVLAFESPEAVLVHEEFAHKWEPETGLESPPKSAGSQFAVPFLKILDSSWAANSRRATAFEEVPTHYCIISLDNAVDVLSMYPPTVRWASPSAVNELFDLASQLGEA